MKVFHILESLESTTSRLEKESILSENKGNELLLKVFKISYDPYVNFYISKFKKPVAKENKCEDETLHEFFPLLEKLSKRELTGNAAKDAVVSAFSPMSAIEQKWCERIILKNLRCGVSDTTINKIWPNTIIPFSVALAETIDAKTTDGEFEIIPGQYTYPVYVEPKLDGLRLIAIKEDGKVNLFTRNGSQIETLPNIVNALEKAKYNNLVLDGEIMGADWNESASVVMSHKNNKDDSTMNYHVFDAISLEEWKSQNSKLDFSARHELAHDIVDMIDFSNVKIVRSILVNSEEDLRKLYLKYLDEGYEGVMIKNPTMPYLWKRSKAVMKLKPVSTHEGVIINWFEGKRGTKREGLFGGFEVMFPNGVATRVASGFSDKLKADIQLDGPDSYIGKIAECESQPPFTPDGRLRFPTFCRFRSQNDVAPEVLEIWNKINNS